MSTEMQTLNPRKDFHSEERSISSWKTVKFANSSDGRLWVKIINGDDGNEDVLNRVVEVIRLEFGGQKVIFKNPSAPRNFIASAWTSKSGKYQLDFRLVNDVVQATIYQIVNKEEIQEFQKIQERNITIKRYNTNEIVRGCKQETYRMDQLLPNQKEDILRSIFNRNIEIINDPIDSYSINILALP